MRKVWQFFLLVSTLFLGSCFDLLDTEYPNLLEPLLDPTKDFYLIIEDHADENAGSDELNLSVVARDICDSLIINGHSFPRTSYSYSENNHYYNMNFAFVQEYWYILDENERMLSYEIVFTDHTISGTIEAPAQLISDFPNFYPDRDYTVNWTIAEDPDFYSYAFWYHDNVATYYNKKGQLDGDKRSHTWKKSNWEDLSYVSFSSASVSATNYDYTRDGLVLVIRTHRSGYIIPPNFVKTPSLRERILSGEIRLPEAKN